MIKELVKIANDLDEKGLNKEADFLDGLIKVAIIIDMPMAGNAERAYRAVIQNGGSPAKAMQALNVYLDSLPSDLMTKPLKAAYRVATKSVVTDKTPILVAKKLARKAFLSAGGSAASPVLTGAWAAPATGAIPAGGARAAAGVLGKLAPAARVLNKVAPPVAIAMGAVDLGRLIYHGWSAFDETKKAHANANIAMAKSRVNRAWTQAMIERKGNGNESNKTQPFLSDLKIMRAWRMDPASVSVDLLGGPLARISAEAWRKAPLEKPNSNFGDLQSAKAILKKLVGSIPETARSAEEIKKEIAGYLSAAVEQKPRA